MNKDLFQWQNLLGYSGAGGYWLFDHINFAIGMALSVTAVVFSVLVNWTKWRAMVNDERRKEELHQIELKKNRHA